MKFNPEKLKVGEKVRLDKDFGNSSIVTIIHLTPLGMIAVVKSDSGVEWSVLTHRLSKI